MQGAAYYNEIDPHAAQWLRNLIAAGHIAPGDVDERSITDVRDDDLRGYRQCHFFAGIGGWSYALRLAGVPHDRSVWTGSCPCQPFSAAGKQRGSEDERHLWPAFFDLIRECRPGTVLGEQVAGAAGYAWFDHVAADLEGEGYAAAAADIGAHSVGAPHRRQRLYWVAHGPSDGWRQGSADGARRGARSGETRRRGSGPSDDCGTGAVAHADAAGSGEQRLEGLLDGQRPAQRDDVDGRGAAGIVGDASVAGLQIERRHRRIPRGAHGAGEGQAAERADTLAAWADLEWLACSDGKARPTQRGIFPLADGLPAGLVRGGDRRLAPDGTAEGRVMRLRGYGNAIVPQLAAAFVRAAL